jgi:non-specific serine/threonine protein kinase
VRDIRVSELETDGRAPPYEAAGVALELAVSPSGQVYLDPRAGDTDLPTPTVAARIRQAFARGGAEGLLHLGAVELESALPPSLAFGRELAQGFMTRLCALPDLEAQWTRLEVPVSADELERLAATVPPMTGAEYVDRERLQALWAGLAAAARAAITAAGGEVQTWLKGLHPSWTLVGRVCFHLAENKDNERAPFAFLATYAARSREARVQHLPLGRALKDYAGDRATPACCCRCTRRPGRAHG